MEDARARGFTARVYTRAEGVAQAKGKSDCSSRRFQAEAAAELALVHDRDAEFLCLAQF